MDTWWSTYHSISVSSRTTRTTSLKISQNNDKQIRFCCLTYIRSSIFNMVPQITFLGQQIGSLNEIMAVTVKLRKASQYEVMTR